MVAALGGVVEGGHDREFGRAELADHRRDAAVRRRVQDRRDGAGVDEPRRPRDAAAAGLPRRRHLDRRAVRGHRRRFAPSSTACSSTPRWCTRRTARKLLANFVHRIAGCAGDWTMAQFRDSEIARIRAQVGDGPRDLRAVRRGRFRRRRAADPRGDRRSAHLHLRRSRPAARRTRRERSSSCSAGITTSRWSRSMPPRASSTRCTASPTPRSSGRRSASCSSTCSRPRPRRSATSISWRKARSIPT